MTFRKLIPLALAGLLALGGVLPVAADNAGPAMTPDQYVAARQAAMKENGRTLRAATRLTGDAAVTALTLVEANYARLPGLFPPNSITGKSIALPAIWQHFDQFSAIFKKGQDAAADAVSAAKAGDMVKYVADIKVIGATCNACHSTFRSKDDD